MGESLATNSTSERLQAFVNVLVAVKGKLGFKASVTVHATPTIVLIIHLAPELIVTGKVVGPRTDHEALLTLYRSICKKTTKTGITIDKLLSLARKKIHLKYTS